MPQKPDLAKREMWRRRLQDFGRGNATIVEFCRRLAVPVSSFYYWRQRLYAGTGTVAAGRQRDGMATPTRRGRCVLRARPAGTKPRLNFVPIQLTTPRTVEVHLPNGARVTVPCIDCDAIAAVIAALVCKISAPPSKLGGGRESRGGGQSEPREQRTWNALTPREQRGSSQAEGRPC